LGFAQYASAIGMVSEVLVVVDDGWKDIPVLLANALFGVIQAGIQFGPGTLIGGLETIRPQFAQLYQKTAFYFGTTNTISTLPSEFGRVMCQGAEGAMHVGYLVSPEESAYWEVHRSKRFQELLQKERVDLFHLSRPSCV
jgi:hypothetical protein